jgi:hypothetical protein
MILIEKRAFSGGKINFIADPDFPFGLCNIFHLSLTVFE